MLRRVKPLVALTLIILWGAGCTLLPSTERTRSRSQDEGPTPTPIPTPIVPTKPTYEVKRGEVIKIVQFSGRVAPVVEEEMFFRTTGRVRNVYVERNEIVTPGQVLADLEIDNLERDLASKLLELERAEQQLAEAEREHTDQLARKTLSLQKAEAELEDAARNQVFDLAQARINVNLKVLQLTKSQNRDLTPRLVQAKASLEEARIDLAQAQSAYDKIAYADTIGQSGQAMNLQRATLQFEKAQAAYDLTMQDIANQRIDTRILDQETEMSRLNLERLETKGPDIDLEQEVILAQLEVEILERGIDPIYNNNVQRARLEVEKLQAAIEEAQLVAPFEGEVTSISLTPGRDATKYKPVAIVADLAELEISANPLDSQLRDLEEELGAVISLANQPGQTYDGVIRRLPYPYGGGGRSDGVEGADTDTSTRISLEVSPRDLGLEDGDLVRVEVIIERKDNVLWLPPQAVRTFDGRRFVVVQDGEAQRRVDVKVGINSEDRVEIEEGLEEGQIIIGP